MPSQLTRLGRVVPLDRLRRLKWLVMFHVAKHCFRTWMAAPMSVAGDTSRVDGFTRPQQRQ